MSLSSITSPVPSHNNTPQSTYHPSAKHRNSKLDIPYLTSPHRGRAFRSQIRNRLVRSQAVRRTALVLNTNSAATDPSKASASGEESFDPAQEHRLGGSAIPEDLDRIIDERDMTIAELRKALICEKDLVAYLEGRVTVKDKTLAHMERSVHRQKQAIEYREQRLAWFAGRIVDLTDLMAVKDERTTWHAGTIAGLEKANSELRETITQRDETIVGMANNIKPMQANLNGYDTLACRLVKEKVALKKKC